MRDSKEIEEAIKKYYPIYDANGAPLPIKYQHFRDTIGLKVQAAIHRSDKQWYGFIGSLKETFPNDLIGDMGGYSFPSHYLAIDFGYKEEKEAFSTHTYILLIQSLLVKGYTAFFVADNILKTFSKVNEELDFPRVSIHFKKSKPNKLLDEAMEKILQLHELYFPDVAFYYHLALHNTAYKFGPSFLKNEWFFERREGCTAFEYLFANDLQGPIIWME